MKYKHPEFINKTHFVIFVNKSSDLTRYRIRNIQIRLCVLDKIVSCIFIVNVYLYTS